jgi:hypothetical protein
MAGRAIEPMEFSVVVILPEDHPAFADGPRTVRYCDGCHRWGQAEATHICGGNWYPELAALIAAERGQS